MTTLVSAAAGAAVAPRFGTLLGLRNLLRKDVREWAHGRRIAVLGEMLELGHAAEELHRQVGRYAAAHGVDMLIGVRGAARAMVESAARAGLDARFFEDPVEAGERARELARPGDAVLFDHLLLHRTGVDPSMTATRYATETWFFAPSAYPDPLKQVPLAF